MPTYDLVILEEDIGRFTADVVPLAQEFQDWKIWMRLFSGRNPDTLSLSMRTEWVG